MFGREKVARAEAEAVAVASFQRGVVRGWSDGLLWGLALGVILYWLVVRED